MRLLCNYGNVRGEKKENLATELGDTPRPSVKKPGQPERNSHYSCRSRTESHH
jgi:hypothetical protein